MQARDGHGGVGRWPAGLAAALRCSRAEAVAVCVLVAGAFAGLGLLWVLASPDPRAAGVVALDDAASEPGVGPAGGAAASPGAGGASVPEVAAGAGAAGAQPGGAVSVPAEVVVHVAGRVEVPGVYRLPGGSRVAEAVAAAGGTLGDADVDALNLARTLVDGEQVRVPAVGELAAPAPSAGPSGGAARRPDGTLDLNLATLGDLDELPGVGPVLAQRVLDHRAEIGRFISVEELRDVKGIGEATFAELAPEVSV